jgi:two-component system phosphate regulon sensor histidine kinase PhoR
MRVNFRFKLMLSYIAVILVSFGVIAFFLDRQLEKRSVHQIESALISQAYIIEDRVASEKKNGIDEKGLSGLIKKMGVKAECRVTVIDRAGIVLADSEESGESLSRMDNHIGRPEVRTALQGNVGVNTRRSPTLGIYMLYVAVPMAAGRDIFGVVRLALPLESVQNTLWSVRRTILLGLLIAVALAVISGSFIASHAIKSIDRMIHVSRKFSEGDFGRRILQAPPDEIGELANTLNKMAQNIEDKIKEIRVQNQSLEAIFNSMVEGVLVVDRASRIISVNRTITKIFGVDKDAVVGKLFLEAIRNNGMAALLNAVLEKGAGVSAELELVYPVRGIFQVNGTPIFDNDNVSGCLAVIHDITQIRRLETVRRDFVANVSHELKTPLTSIKGFVETLRDGAIEDKENSRTFLDIIQDHADRLDKLVNDLLVLSRLESEEIFLDRTTFNIKKQVDEVLMGFQSLLKKRGISVKNELSDSLSVDADKDRMVQVVTNLMDNAIKFNKTDGYVKIYGFDDGTGIRIVFEDSGCGIPVKDMPRIFERFYRVDKARSREMGGTGLGLSIVKHIIELHGGEVGVESIEGAGSKFWFTLPAHKTAA